MILKITSSEYGDYFDASFFHGVNERTGRRFTCVELTPENCEYVSAFGKADCALGDNFSKAQGRKIALQRAIRFIPRKLRRQIWNEYWRAIGQNQRVREALNANSR